MTAEESVQAGWEQGTKQAGKRKEQATSHAEAKAAGRRSETEHGKSRTTTATTATKQDRSTRAEKGENKQTKPIYTQ